jgi:hypothetical protein
MLQAWQTILTERESLDRTCHDSDSENKRYCICSDAIVNALDDYALDF